MCSKISSGEEEQHGGTHAIHSPSSSHDIGVQSLKQPLHLEHQIVLERQITVAILWSNQSHIEDFLPPPPLSMTKTIVSSFHWWIVVLIWKLREATSFSNSYMQICKKKKKSCFLQAFICLFVYAFDDVFRTKFVTIPQFLMYECDYSVNFVRGRHWGNFNFLQTILNFVDCTKEMP